ncbi:T9SS type A sorting domain-containing protein [Runella zeae]|uniref:T9SS type A sorting domain-containing protein n=1 Tax=Runella zeae TaxID=94255 RepID=UPI00048A77A8|nr:T9SS type A sorting domain-containing protein [Runella zeae]
MIANLQQSYMIAFFLIGSVLFGATTSVVQSPAPYILSANPYSTDIYTVPIGGPYRTKIAAKSAQEGITVGRAGAVMISAPGGKGSLLGGGAGNGKGSSGQVVIEYVGRATPNLSINLTSTWEGNAGNTIYTFSVTLSEPAPAGGVSFDIATADNTATTADNDYTAKSLTSQTIPEGNSTYTFTVSVNGDLKFEPDESFFVNITNVTGANVRDAQGIGIIANDDADCSSSTVTTGTTFCNEGGITINDNGVAMPYPSCISVSGLMGTIEKVTITLKNLTHTAPDAIDLLLYSPTGQKYVFMSDVGGTNAVTGLDLILDSSAASVLPDNTTLVSGTFRPADFEASADVFPAPAPAGPYYSASTTSLGTLLNNSNPNGTWYLYAVDDAATNTGSIGGWCLNFTMSCTPPNITAPTVTQPTCAVPTGTIVVNATGTGALEYSINNGTDWQVGSTFSGLSAGDYNIKVRTQGSPSCETSYGNNPVLLTSPPNVTAGTLSSNVESICQGGSVDMRQVGQTGTSAFFIFQNNIAIVSYASIEEVEAFFATAAPNQYCVYTIAYLELNNGCGNVAGFTLSQIIDACLDEQCYDISEPVCITVAANNTVGAASSTPTVCINTSLTSITHTTTGATGIGTATGLPSGVSAAWAANMLTISGTPTEVGIFTYSIPLTGGCGNVNATGMITVNPLPTATISGGGTVCQNATSRSITFTGAAGTAPYTFTYKVNNGTDQTVTTTNGNSVDVNQSTNNRGGYIYTVVSVKDGSLTQCSQTQGGTATITVNAQPVAPSLNTKTPNVSTICIGTVVSAAFTAGSGGVGCSDDFIVIIDEGSPVAYTAGTLVGSTATSSVVIKGRRANCTSDASCNGTDYVTLAEWGVITSLANFTLSSPTALCLSGGGNVPNATLSLSGSQLGVIYQLYKNGSPVGNSLLGTGSKLSFVVPMSVGSYTVVGRIYCNNVSGTISGTVVIGSQPTAYSVSGGGSYCSGGVGVAVGLSASQVGVNYQLRRSNVNMGSVVSGTGYALSFGNQTAAGTYTVVGIEALSGCSRTMSGSKTVTLSNCAGREGLQEVSNAEVLLGVDWVSLYPNPVIKERAELMIQGQSGKEVEWRLMSAGGQELRSHKMKMKESVERVGISLQGMSAGAYLIQVIVDDKRATLKVVKSE